MEDLLENLDLNLKDLKEFSLKDLEEFSEGKLRNIRSGLRGEIDDLKKQRPTDEDQTLAIYQDLADYNLLDAKIDLALQK